MKTEEILNEDNEEQQRSPPLMIDLIRLNAKVELALLEFNNFIEDL